MSEEKKDGLTVDNINSLLEEKLSKSFENFSSEMDQKFQKNNKEDVGEVSDFSSNDDDDQEVVTKSDLKKILSDVPKMIEKKALEIANNAIELKTNKYSKDALTMQEFPLLNPQSQEYSKDFQKDVQAEIHRRISSGVSNDNPDLVYDSASVVENKWIKSGKYIPKKVAEKYSQEPASKGGFFGGNFSSKTSGNTPNASQINLAKSLGVKEEFFTNYMKNK